jgi:hypothetical protein
VNPCTRVSVAYKEFLKLITRNSSQHSSFILSHSLKLRIATLVYGVQVVMSHHDVKGLNAMHRQEGHIYPVTYTFASEESRFNKIDTLMLQSG